MSWTVHGSKHYRRARARAGKRTDPGAMPEFKDVIQHVSDRDSAERLALHLVESGAVDTATFWEDGKP